LFKSFEHFKNSKNSHYLDHNAQAYKLIYFEYRFLLSQDGAFGVQGQNFEVFLITLYAFAGLNK